MSALQGLVSYPGMTTFKSAQYTASQGIAPGIVTLEMPQELVSGLQQQGNFTFSYGDAYVTLFNCVLDTGQVGRSGGGFIARVQIFDRRWAWKFGYINGHYNLPKPGPTTSGWLDSGNAAFDSSNLVRQDTQQYPQQLATLCLNAMGETNFDVTALPNATTPEVHWSYENPAAALEQLCESLGCRVVLNLDSNTVQIVVIGEGDQLPSSPVQWVSEGVSIPEPPSSLLFVSGQTLQQAFIPLVAVGLDTNGSVQTIANLSYDPQPNGWASQPLSFPSIASEPAHTYAEESVYRWWQPNVPFTAPDGTLVTDIKQLILYSRLIETNQQPTGPNDATTQHPEIVGNFDPFYAQTTTSMPNQNQPPVYKGSVSIDQNRCVVITGDQLVNNNAGQYQPPTLYLKTSFSVRDSSTGEPSHYTQNMQLASSPNATQPEIVRHDDVILKYTQGYQSGSSQNNKTAVSQAATYYLQARAIQYQPAQQLDVPYVGIVPIQVDGAIYQVTYSVHSGEGGACLTHASRNTEHSHYIPRFRLRSDKRSGKAVADRVIARDNLVSQQQQQTDQPFIR